MVGGIVAPRTHVPVRVIASDAAGNTVTQTVTDAVTVAAR
jgi:hypothetical protein